MHFFKQGFFSLEEKKTKTRQFEWWEEEEYSPGIALLPIGIFIIKRYDMVKKRLQTSKLNIHVHSLLLQEKQPDVIIINDGDSSDISDKGSGKNKCK